MYTKKIGWLFIPLSFFSAASVHAQAKTINVVTTAVPFLRISPNVRAGGMGNASIAISPDATAIYSNPGKIPFATNRGALTASYCPWLKSWGNDMYLASLGGYYQLGESEALYGSIQYFSLGDMRFIDNNGNYLQSHRPNEFGINAGYARQLSTRSGIALSLKYVASNLASKSLSSDYRTGEAIAADLSFYHRGTSENEEGWSWGAMLSNLGSKISYTKSGSQQDFIPANLGLGLSYAKPFDDQNKLNLGLDVNKLLVPTPPKEGDLSGLARYRNKSVVGSWLSSFGDAPGGFDEELREFQISAGLEYWHNNQFALRTGYFYEDRTKGDRRYFTAGIGARYNTITLDFSYAVTTGKQAGRDPLANSLQFALNIDFNN